MGVLTVHLLTAGVASHVIAGGEAPAAPASDDNSTSVWLLLAIALLGSSVLAGVITSVLGNLRAAATARREGYANAVRSLISRGEYPYRVRRRVSDDPEVLSALVERGHDLQEQLAACRTWVASEHQVLGTLFEAALAAIDGTVGPAIKDAWNQPPITVAAGMNLDGWGPGDPWPHVAKLERAIAFRFGPRRLVPSSLWQSLI
ncbi:hypothetical protein [Nocardioides insulae]|uniref:hypothetical protein n=1 Tax=Nocardioides insulae TaxID=394734 RepID=UPI00041B6F30|nr:hypothetical protein [Nocardioides insulae]